MEQSGLDLREVFLILRRRWWLIVTLPLIAALAAGVFSFFLLTPVYSASTTLLVGEKDSARISSSDLQLNRSLTRTYAEVAISRVVIADVIERLQLRVSIPGLQSRVTVVPKRDTEILVFTVRDGDPVMAALIADAVAESFKRQLKAYLNVENIMVLDLALIPTAPINSRSVSNVVIAFIVGLMLALGFTFLLEYLDTSIKSPEDVTRHLGLPVLGLIPVFGDEAGVKTRRSRSAGSKTKTVIEQ